MTTCNVDGCSLTTVRVIWQPYPTTPTRHYRLLNRTPTNQTGTRKYFKDNSIGGLEFLPTILTTQTQLFKQATTGSTSMNIGSIWPMTQQPTLTVCVSMPWTMWMLTFSRSLQITSKQPMVLTSLKPMRSNTCHARKRGLTTHITTRTLRGHNYRLNVPS